MAKEGLTPMMKQLYDLKAKHPDAIMLFRCGDFYETYCEDAVVASEILGITLTKRNNGGKNGEPVEMAGFPYHALDTYLPKLVRAGRRVAICDQLEDPKLTKTLVKRGITELVTPGVSMNDNVLNNKENNFLSAVHFGVKSCGVAFLDISTGEFLTAEGSMEYVDKLLGNFAPKEVLFERGKRNLFEGNFGTKFFTFELDDWVFSERTAMEKLLKHFEVKNLKGFGIDHLKCGIVAAGAVLQYLDMTQHTQTGHITSIARIEEERYVRLDKFTVRNLELLNPLAEGGKSLLNVIDHTVTPMGARLMRRWLLFPLKDEKPVNERLDVVDYFFREPEFRELGEHGHIAEAVVGEREALKLCQLGEGQDIAVLQAHLREHEAGHIERDGLASYGDGARVILVSGLDLLEALEIAVDGLAVELIRADIEYLYGLVDIAEAGVVSVGEQDVAVFAVSVLERAVERLRGGLVIAGGVCLGALLVVSVEPAAAVARADEHVDKDDDDRQQRYRAGNKCAAAGFVIRSCVHSFLRGVSV